MDDRHDVRCRLDRPVTRVHQAVLSAIMALARRGRLAAPPRGRAGRAAGLPARPVRCARPACRCRSRAWPPPAVLGIRLAASGLPRGRCGAARGGAAIGWAVLLGPVLRHWVTPTVRDLLRRRRRHRRPGRAQCHPGGHLSRRVARRRRHRPAAARARVFYVVTAARFELAPADSAGTATTGSPGEPWPSPPSRRARSPRPSGSLGLLAAAASGAQHRHPGALVPGHGVAPGPASSARPSGPGSATTYAAGPRSSRSACTPRAASPSARSTGIPGISRLRPGGDVGRGRRHRGRAGPAGPADLARPAPGRQ